MTHNIQNYTTTATDGNRYEVEKVHPRAAGETQKFTLRGEDGESMMVTERFLGVVCHATRY